MAKWPNWYAGLALGVEHLVGLEDYLLARVGMSDRSGHGIEYFDWKKSVTLQDEGGRTIKVTGPIKGVTPGGHPAVFETNQTEVLPLNVPGQGELVLDLAIQIRADDAESRVQIKAIPTTAEADAVRSDEPNLLYLGRFRFGRQADKELLKKPLVRRLSSLQPLDGTWQQWVNPFVTRLADVLRLLENEAESGNRHAAMSASALSEIAFDWPNWNLPQLERRLRYACWLASGAIAARDIAGTVPSASAFPPRDPIGDEIPHLLADSLVLQPMHKTLPELLDQLLGPIDLRVRINEFFEWAEHLGHSDHIDIERIAKALRGPLKKLDPWARAVGLITMARVGGDPLNQWPADILSGYFDSPKNSLEREVAKALQKLYTDEAQKRLAGPLGFYCLARAAQRVTSDIQDHELQLYFRSLNGNVRLSPISQPRSDRVLDFLQNRNRLCTNRGQDSAELAKSLKWKAMDRAEAATPVIQIQVLGAERSGKSALIREYTALLNYGAISEDTLRQRDQERQQAADACCEVRGVKVALRFVEKSIEAPETAPSLLRTDPVDCECEVVVLVMDAKTIDVRNRPIGLMNSLIRACKTLKRREPLVAMVIYSKSDEYGALNPDVVRVDANSVNWVDRDAWLDFIERSTATGSDTSWNESRKTILDQTRELWTELCAEERILQSGYFVAAEPVEVVAKFGIVESLNDLCERCVDQVIHRLH